MGNFIFFKLAWFSNFRRFIVNLLGNCLSRDGVDLHFIKSDGLRGEYHRSKLLENDYKYRFSEVFEVPIPFEQLSQYTVRMSEKITQSNSARLWSD